MIKRFRLQLMVMLALVFFGAGCMQDEFEFDKLSDEMEFRVGVIVPAVKGSLSLDDLISEFDSSSVITTDPEGLLYLTYQDSLTAFTASELIDIPDQQFDEVVLESDVDVPPYINWGDSIVVERARDITWVYAKNERLDSIRLYSGSFRFEVSSTFQHTGYVELSSDRITRDGEPYRQKIQISSTSGNYNDVQVFDLSGYTFKLDADLVSGESSVDLDIRLVLYDSGAGVVSGDRVDINTSITDLEFESMYGYVGDYELAGEAGSFDINFFDKSLEGDIYFEDPQVKFLLSNGYGIPVEVDIQQFEGTKEDVAPVSLAFSPDANPLSIAYPNISQEGESVKDTLFLSKENSSIDDFLNFQPTAINYQVSAQSNPEGDEEIFNFVSRDSELEVGVEFTLPLWFSATDFSLQDTIDLDLTDIDNYDSLDELGITLDVTNEMPVQIQMQVIFMDQNYQPLDVLFVEGEEVVIPASTVDAQGDVVATSQKVTEVVYGKQHLENIEQTIYAAIVARMETADYAPENRVKFYDHHKVQFHLSVDADATLNSNDL